MGRAVGQFPRDHSLMGRAASLFSLKGNLQAVQWFCLYPTLDSTAGSCLDAGLLCSQAAFLSALLTSDQWATCKEADSSATALSGLVGTACSQC